MTVLTWSSSDMSEVDRIGWLIDYRCSREGGYRFSTFIADVVLGH